MFQNSFPERAFMARQTARILLEIDAVNFRAEPYILTSGLASPTYIDCRKIISHPRARATLADFACSLLLRECGYESFDIVAGGETAGIPFAAFIAERLALPMVYVRKKPKGFGKNALIEGEFGQDDRIVLIEDLTTDGGSKIKFAKAIRESGGAIGHTFAIFYYDIFKQSAQRMEKAGLRLHYLATWRDILQECRESAPDRFDKSTLAMVDEFLGDPMGWSKAHGGIDTLPND